MQYTCVLEVNAMHVSGKVREATCWITGQITGDVLAPTDLDTKTGKTILQSLKDTPPPPPGRPDLLHSS